MVFFIWPKASCKTVPKIELSDIALLTKGSAFQTINKTLRDHSVLKPTTVKNRNFLFWAAGGWLLLTVATGVYFLFQATVPSADVASVSRSNVYNLSVGSFEPGQTATFKLDEVPVIVWRRDFEQKVQALELLGIDFSGSASLLEEVRANVEIEIEPDRVLRFEWFVVSPINTGGHGCIVLPDAGDFGGFYDPCQGVHFDLWGRVRVGPTEVDLQVLPWRFSDDGSAIVVDVGDAPRL